MNLKYQIYSIIWALIILVLTLMPGKHIPNVAIIGIDKLVHFFIFGVLMFLAYWGFMRQAATKQMNFNPLFVAYLWCIGFGIAIELIQNYVPGRSCSLYDVIANSIGVFIGHLMFKLTFRKYLSK